MLKEIKCIVLVLWVVGCDAQIKVTRTEGDAKQFVARQRYVNSQHTEAEELEEIMNDFVLQPLMYSSPRDYMEQEDESYAKRTTQTIENSEKLVNGTIKPTSITMNLTEFMTTLVTNITMEPTSVTDVTMEPTTVTNLTLEPTTMVVTDVILEPTICIRDLVTLATDILEKEHYALMMLDSYGKPPPGILQGNLLWLGLYDQCLNQSRKIIEDDQGDFDAQYCLASVVNTSNPSVPLLNVGICVPDTCSRAELMDLLKVNNNNSSIIVSVTCHKEFEYSASAIACLTLLAVLGCLILAGSTIEIFSNFKHLLIENKGFQKLESEGIQAGIEKTNTEIKDNSEEITHGYILKFLLCFSLLMNGSKILKTKQGEGSLSALNGFRVLSLWWVILGHSYIFSMQLIKNPSTILEVLGRFSFQAVGNATFSVDSFFFLSGLLVTYLTLKYLQKNEGNLNWVMFYVHRYLRLTPVYALVIFMFTVLPPYFADGPLYSFIYDPNPDPGVENQLTLCQKYWWTNLLYINNLYPKELGRECIGWSWYLANDMQFYVISPFVIYLLYHYFFAGVTLWGVLLLTCFSSLIGESIKRDLSADMIPQDPNQKTFLADNIYVQPWARISAYLVGMAVGYILYKYRGRVHMPRLVVILGWMAATVIGLAVVYGLYGTFHGHPLSKGATVVYITLSRFAWTVAIGWVVFACATGNGGPVNTLLSWSFWIPLARISYCAYLVHPMIILVFYYSLPTTIYFTDFLMIYFFLGHLVLSYACAFILSICAEAPFMALEKLFLKRDKSV